MMECNIFLEEIDSINCGRCGRTFQSLETFKLHKLSASGCQQHPLTKDVIVVDATTTAATTSSSEPNCFVDNRTMTMSLPISIADPTFHHASLLQPPLQQQQQHQVVYLNNSIIDRALWASLFGSGGGGGSGDGGGAANTDATTDTTGAATANVSPVDFIPSASDAIIDHSTPLYHHYPLHETFSVNEETTHLTALIDVNNGLISSQGLDISTAASVGNVQFDELESAAAPTVVVRDSSIADTKGVNLDRASPRLAQTVDIDDDDNGEGKKSSTTSGGQKPAKRQRNKVMRLPAKTPLNLTAKKSSSLSPSSSDARRRPSGPSGGRNVEGGGGGGATMTQTQTTRVFKFACPYCQKLFCKKFDLEAHARVHTGEKPFQCCICGKGFAQKSNVKKHLSTHKSWPEGRVSLPRTSLLVGTAEATTTMRDDNDAVAAAASREGVIETLVSSYYCQFCEEKFGVWTQLSSHLAAKHKDRQVFKCRVDSCPEFFAEAGQLVAHLSNRHDPAEIRYRCDDCSLDFPTLQELGIHHYRHTAYLAAAPPTATSEDANHVTLTGKSTSSSAKYSCSKCNDKFSKEDALKEHLKTVSHSFPCQICLLAAADQRRASGGKVGRGGVVDFPSERLLRKHLKESHAIAKHSCPICVPTKTFKTAALLRAHLSSHGPSIFECEEPLCRRKFKRKDQLTRHRLTVHGKLLRFRCPYKGICSKRFARRDQLRVHMCSSHEGVRPYKCRLCAKSFLTKHHLVEHESIHADARKFRCVKCGRGFLRQRQLERHSCDIGDRWKRKLVASSASESTSDSRSSWRESTLLRSGRRTKPPQKSEEAAMEDLDAAFGIVVVEAEEGPSLPTQSEFGQNLIRSQADDEKRNRETANNYFLQSFL